MIDTIRLKIPIVAKNIYSLANALKTVFEVQFSVDKNNNLTKVLIKKNIPDTPSWNSGITMAVFEDHIDCEASIPKKLLGNNIGMIHASRCQDFLDLIYSLLVEALNKSHSRLSEKNTNEVGVNLSDREWDTNLITPVDFWRVNRIDFCFNYDVGTQENVIEYLKAFNRLNDKNEDCIDYGKKGLWVKRKRYVFKMYNKLLEFIEHDKKLIEKYSPEEANKLMEKSRGILRLEVQLRKKEIERLLSNNKWDHLKKLLENDNKAIEILEKYLYLYGKGVKKFMTDQEALVLIQKEFKTKEEKTKAIIVFNYWDKYIDGIEVSKRTYYRIRKKLKKLGIGIESEQELKPLIINNIF